MKQRQNTVSAIRAQDINFHQLHCFYVVAAEGSVKMACQKLNLSQPAVSLQIKGFEEFVGQELFERKHRKLELNRLGKRIYREAESIFVASEQFVRAIQKAPRLEEKNLVLGVTPDVPNTKLNEIVRDFWVNASLRVDIVQGNQHELHSFLDKNKVQLILASESSPRSSRYKSRRISSEKLFLVGAAKFKHLRKKLSENLNGERFFVLSPTSRMGEEITLFIEEQKLNVDVFGSIDDSALLREIARDGLGLAVLPESSVKEDLKSKALYNLQECKGISFELWATSSKSASKSINVKRALNRLIVRFSGR